LFERVIGEPRISRRALDVGAHKVGVCHHAALHRITQCGEHRPGPAHPPCGCDDSRRGFEVANELGRLHAHRRGRAARHDEAAAASRGPERRYDKHAFAVDGKGSDPVEVAGADAINCGVRAGVQLGGDQALPPSRFSGI
jgi:hypothetical protein